MATYLETVLSTVASTLIYQSSTYKCTATASSIAHSGFFPYPGVSPVYTDEDTCSFVMEQREQQYRDLLRALSVMGRMRYQEEQQRTQSASVSPAKKGSLALRDLPALASTHASSSELTKKAGSSTHSRSYDALDALSESEEKVLKSKASPVSSASDISHRSLVPEHMVLMYLLENNRLLLSSINQMRQGTQVKHKM